MPATWDSIAYRLLKLVSTSRNRLTEAEVAAQAERRDHQASQARWFLSLLDGSIDYQGKTVLDIGSGYGDLCIQLAKTGAQSVVGVDIDPVRVDRARRLAEQEGVQELVKFQCADFVKDFKTTQQFNLILSFDAFEHILDPLGCLQKAFACLPNRGSLATLFGPLWWSPNGAHTRGFTRLPWVHILFPEKVVLRVRAEYYRPDQTVERYEDIVGHLSRMTVMRFRQYAAQAGFKIRLFRLNPDKDWARHGILRPFNSIVNGMPVLRELGAQLLLAILDKP
jgi:SAM-dependent methyltransferase